MSRGLSLDLVCDLLWLLVRHLVDDLVAVAKRLLLPVHVLLFGRGHLAAHGAVLRLLVDLLHVGPRRQHLVLRHRHLAARPTGPLLALSFSSLLRSALVQGRVQLRNRK